MRILLFTGKGGVGKSTIASGTAALAAADGHRTLVLSTGSAPPSVPSRPRWPPGSSSNRSMPS